MATILKKLIKSLSPAGFFFFFGKGGGGGSNYVDLESPTKHELTETLIIHYFLDNVTFSNVQ